MGKSIKAILIIALIVGAIVFTVKRSSKYMVKPPPNQQIPGLAGQPGVPGGGLPPMMTPAPGTAPAEPEG